MCDWSWKWSYILFFQDLERINKNRKLKPYKNGKYILCLLYTSDFSGIGGAGRISDVWKPDPRVRRASGTFPDGTERAGKPDYPAAWHQDVYKRQAEDRSTHIVYEKDRIGEAVSYTHLICAVWEEDE